MNYQLELFLTHSCLLGLYWIFLKGESDFQKLRIFLIGSTTIAALAPLIVFPSLSLTSLMSTENASGMIKSIVLEPASITNEYLAETSPIEWLRIVYWTVSSLLGLRLFYSLGQLLMLKANSRPSEQYEKVFIIPGKRRTFAFFRWVFMSEDLHNAQDARVVINHERAHARLGHSYDSIFVQLFTVFCWWMPGSWIMNHELKKIHEYEADRYALRSVNAEEYKKALISSTLKNHGLILANSFYGSSIIKRLEIMKLKTTRLRTWKIWTVSALSAILVVIISCTDEIGTELTSLQENTYQTEPLTSRAKAMVAEAQAVNPNVRFKYLEYVLKEGEETEIKKMIENLDPELIEAIDVDKKEGVIGVLVREGNSIDRIAKLTRSQDDVFTIVDQTPEYPGGMARFYEEFSQTLIYPEQARKEGITGKVYVKFVVEKDGSLSGFEGLKSPDPMLTKAAIQAMTKMSAFKPGRYNGENVRVRMVLPVVFALPGVKETSSSYDVEKVELITPFDVVELPKTTTDDC